MKKLFRITLSILITMFGFIFSYSSADATGMTITLTPGWNVISTPALLSDVSFSNGGNGITFSKLESGQWISVVPNTNEFIPLEGFLVRNTNTSNVDMTLSFRDTTPSEDMLSKKISEGWNLLGITTLNDPFYSITPKLYLDFTSNFQVNLFNTININYLAGNGTVPTPEYGEAYGIFVSSNSLYGGSNNRNVYDGKISNKSDYEPIIKVTPGSYNIPLLKGTITVDKTVSLNNSGLYIEINGANPFEDIGGYEAGGIIYEILVKVDSCVGHLSYNRYDDFGLDNGVTDESGYKKLPVYLDKCTKLSAGTHEISVLMGINREYYQNFKTGMTITMSPITVRSFNNSSIAGQILPSVVEVSHDNLPHLLMGPSNHYVDEVYIDSGVAVFPLWAGNLFIDETGVVASILLSSSNITDNDVVSYNMYVDTYVNGELLDTQLYKQTSIKHEIPLEYNTNTLVEFRGRMISNITGAFIPTVTVNKIIKNNISYITHSCDYYAGWCTNFGMGNYIFDGKPSYVNGSVASGSISNDIDYTPLIKVTPGSYNIPLIKGRVYIDDEAYLNMDRFIVSIFGANPYEDVLGYEAGGIIYDMTVRVGDCVSSVSNDLYNIQTNADGFAQFSVPIPEECKTVPAGATKIEVSMGINNEYYRNFKTGMIITIDPSIVGTDFNSLHITGKIKSSAIHVSHNNLPRLTVSNFTDPTNVFYINSGAYEFPLRSGDFYTDETGVVANVLLKKTESTGFDMYVSTYVNGGLVDEQPFDGVFIKHEIPLEYDTPTTVEFKGRMASNTTGYMRPSVIVNRIIKNDINYITHNCDYYAGWCNEFGLGNYIFYGGGIGIGVGSNNYPTELVQAYNYAYDHGLTTANNIDNAGMYDNITRIAYLQIISDYAINVLGLTPDDSLSCDFPDITPALGDQYDTVKKACKLGLIGVDEGNGSLATNLNPNMILTRDYFGTLLSRALNANDTTTLAELNDSDPYYQKHLAFLKTGGILNNSNPDEVEVRGYIFLMLMRADDSYVPSEGCTAEEMLQCLTAEDYDACIAICTCASSASNVTHTTASTWSNAIALSNVSCTWDGTKATIRWVPTNDIGNIKISLYNESTNNFDVKGTINAACQNTFTFNVTQPQSPIVRFDDTEGLSAYKTYTCHKLSTSTPTVTPTVTPTTTSEWCTAEELSACLTSPDYNACIANCQ